MKMESPLALFWQAYLINFLFWSSLAQGAVIFAAALDLVTARDMHEYARISRRFAAFLPVVVIAFLGMAFGGKEQMFPWILAPRPKVELYLNFPFFVLRDTIGLALLAILSFVFLKKTKMTQPGREKPAGASVWAVVLVILFMIVYFFLSYDLIISLSHKWWSTLFPGYYSFSAFYLGAAGLYAAGYFGKPDIITDDRRKLALLLFGFAPFWFYLLWAQYVVLWYNDLPALARVLKPRFFEFPWLVATWIVIGFVFALPLVILLSKKAKVIPSVPLLACIFVFLGLMLEKYMLIVPYFSPASIGIGWIHLWVTLGYALVFLLSYWVGGLFLRSARA